MKTGMNIKMKSFSILAMVATLSMMAACKKASDNNNVPVGVTPLACAGTICANVGAAPGVLISATGTTPIPGSLIGGGVGGQLSIAVDIFGDTAQFNINNPKGWVTYNGPAALSGYFVVQGGGAVGTPAGLSFCGAYPGEYYMQAMQPGSMTQGVVTGGLIAGTGPNGGRIEATIIKGILLNPQDPNGTSKGSATNRLSLSMIITMVNGQPCNLNLTTN